MPDDPIVEDLINKALEAELAAELAVSDDAKAQHWTLARRLREHATVLKTRLRQHQQTGYKEAL